MHLFVLFYLLYSIMLMIAHTNSHVLGLFVHKWQIKSLVSHVSQEHGRAFRSKPLVDVDPKCLLYVQQREFAATTPADSE